ncbi:RDD family protein [Hoyosella altamirensis]|uniref:Putative RDD family membrane protein YckC n=1 Tax=Hoyosella altamirensis TaxID=616997 RepID=A0A839RHY4_9ACTN|nr:RDD family protein [Hoyosella altamirensis]MBB3035733.1 putative RDD family membrane protein YckC [Hoyosella altamirensis]
MSSGGYDPETNPQFAGTGFGTKPAGVAPRGIARLIDWVIAGILGAIVFWLLRQGGEVPAWAALLPGAGFGFLYFLVFEVTTGSTPGKKVLGLHVMGSGGRSKPSLKESAVRNAYMLLNLISFVGSLLWLIAVVAIGFTISTSSAKQGFHDRIAGGTQVVKK